jgi:hypothetical protein
MNGKCKLCQPQSIGQSWSLPVGGRGRSIPIFIYYYYFEDRKKARNISKMSTLLRKSEHLNPFKCQLEPSMGLEVRRGRGN